MPGREPVSLMMGKQIKRAGGKGNHHVKGKKTRDYLEMICEQSTELGSIPLTQQAGTEPVGMPDTLLSAGTQTYL